MPIFAIPAIVGGIIAGGGAIAGSAIASHEAGKAANTQANAALSAQQLQAKEAQDALDFQKQQYATNQAQIAPWLKAGTTAINQLAGETVPSFQAPTAATEQNDPGYQFRLSQGMDALQNSAAAKGGLLSGNTLKGIEDYSQNYASNEYSNVYGRAMNEYNTNVLGPYNRLSALAGIGQQAQATGAQQGANVGNNITNIDLATGQQQGNSVLQAGAARASGYAANGNIWGSALSGIGNNIGNAWMLKNLGGGNNWNPDQNQNYNLGG